MLAMRPDWTHDCSGAIATELFEQIQQAPLKREFARHIIGASLELLIEGICKHPPAPLLKELPCDFRWDIHDTTYVYFPDVDDAALDKAVEYSSIVPQVSIIVPTGYSEILENACRNMLLSLAETMSPHQRRRGRRIPRERHMPLIRPLDTHISFRTSFTAADLGWTNNHAVLELFRRHNRRVIDAACDESILVDIPPECSCLP